MKPSLLFLYLILGGLTFGFAQTPGTVQESVKLSSKILGKEVKFSLYLPPDYESSARRYPVVYLLHGYTDDETGWLQFGEAAYIADDAIHAREIPPMIIIMPDGGVSWYINDAEGAVRYEDFLVEELIPYIDQEYRTRPTKEFRGIAGLSMGGYGSLILSMHHPELFTACAAFSSGVWSDDQMAGMEQTNYDRTYGILYGKGLSGEARLTDTWRKNSVLHQAEILPEKDLKSVRWYIDCGDDDFLFKGNSLLHISLRERNIPHEYRVRDGAHSWEYWRMVLPIGLGFIGESFHR